MDFRSHRKSILFGAAAESAVEKGYSYMFNKSILCAICAQQGKTCCVGTDIFVTPGDVRRIAAFTSNHDFYEFRSSSIPSYRDQSDDPVWDTLVFRSDGTRRVIKHSSSGACLFLDPQGCRLPISVRPLVCRLHPHIYNAQGLYPGLAPDCPINLLPIGNNLEMAIAGFSNEEAMNWHHLLYEEIKEKGDEP
ncbi:MAG: YkgJ family cysteine cluster protein [Deltaproteobacteria bacterium]|nr:YkgJ family cysteine cluster protein [Deltaproteobacteria bacterium]